MTDEKRHIDLSKVQPVFRGADPDDDPRASRGDVDRVGTAAASVAGGPPAVGVLPEPDDQPPPDPDDLDQLRRG